MGNEIDNRLASSVSLLEVLRQEINKKFSEQEDMVDRILNVLEKHADVHQYLKDRIIKLEGHFRSMQVNMLLLAIACLLANVLFWLHKCPR